MDLVHKINSLRAQPVSWWLSTANQHMPAVVSFVLVVVIALYLVRLIWVLVPPVNNFDWTEKSAAVVTSAPGAEGLSAATFRTIATAHLFGVAGAEPARQTATEAPETRLNLKLRATVAAADDSLAHAIIADGNGKDEVYFINERVAGGAILHEIRPDRVILNRGGVLETLKLPKLSESLGRGASRQASERPAAAQPGPAQGVIRGPDAFTDVLRPQPFMPNGELKGYRVYPGRDRRRFAALGLRPGDLVTDINGQTLDNLQDGMEVFRKLADSSQIVVTIERNGSPMVLTLQTEDLVGGNPGGEE